MTCVFRSNKLFRGFDLDSFFSEFRRASRKSAADVSQKSLLQQGRKRGYSVYQSELSEVKRCTIEYRE